MASFEEAEEVLRAGAQPGDLVLTVGAGDVTLLSERLLQTLERHPSNSSPESVAGRFSASTGRPGR